MNKNYLAKHIPNSITMLNLLMGCIAIAHASAGDFHQSFMYILLAALFDFFDGFAARYTNSHSEYGKLLDSLADMVSFGLAPSVIMYNLIDRIYARTNLFMGFELFETGKNIILGSAFAIAVFSALRLAKFHFDVRQRDSFVGLPTPANAIFIASFANMVFSIKNPAVFNFFINLNFIVLLIFSLCFLMIAEIPMFSLKFKNFSPRKNFIRYLFSSLSILLILYLKKFSFPLIIVLYVFLSILLANTIKTKTT